MNTENALLGLILAGTGLCLAYFWAEIARRKQDRARAAATTAEQPTAVKRPFCVRRIDRTPQRQANTPDRQQAA
jgi:hypothetical protein